MGKVRKKPPTKTPTKKAIASADSNDDLSDPWTPSAATPSSSDSSPDNVASRVSRRGKPTPPLLATAAAAPVPAKAKAKASAPPKKRPYQSDTNNNSNTNSNSRAAENGPAKRVRTQRKPFQSDDPIPKKILSQLLAADDGNKSKSKPGTSSAVLPSTSAVKPATTSKLDVKDKAKASRGKPKASPKKTPPPNPVQASKAVGKSVKKPATKVGVPTKRLSTTSSTATKARARVSVGSDNADTKGTNKKKTVKIDLPKPSTPPAQDDRPPFTTSTKITTPRKSKPAINKVSNSSKKITKKKSRGSDSSHGPAATSTKAAKAKVAKTKKRKDALKDELEAMAAPSPLPINAVTTPSPKKRKKLAAMNPRPNVTEYNVDPTFDMDLPMPFISSLIHSKLVIRAVRTDNTAQLQALMKDSEHVCSFWVPKCLSNDNNAYREAIRANNMVAMKLLVDSIKSEDKLKLAPYPDLLLQTESTGQPSYRMFGHAMRNVSVARGSKEGNDALIKDQMLYRYKSKGPGNDTSYDVLHYGLEKGLPWVEIVKLMQVYDFDTQEACKNNFLYRIHELLWRGHVKLAGDFVEIALTRGGFGFNQLHKEALTLSNGTPFTPFKSISITKKATSCNRVTPVHCAAINPDPYYIKTLLGIRPEYNALDLMGKSPIHYAAANAEPAVLEFLLPQGISVLLPDKEGKTPLYIAAELGRVKNVRAIIRSQQILEGGDAQTASTDFNKDPIVNRPNLKNGQSPIHIAIEKGHFEVVNALLDLGASPDRQLSAQFEKLTPAMIAAKFGHLEILKLLIEKGQVNIEEVDKRGKTALTHAVIEGQGHIVSFLLRLGVNNQVKDTSGNTLAHYAAAYGWYFIWNLLMESGCSPNESNDWKMTPVGIAFLKGHMGLVEVILRQPGIDINAPINDTTGRNLLLEICDQLSSSFTAKLKFLIEEQGADCNAVDLEGNNALFYLVACEAKQIAKRMFCFEWVKKEMAKSPRHKKFGVKENPMLESLIPDDSYSTAYTYEELAKNREMLHEAVLLLLRRGCNPSTMNSHSTSAITLAFMVGCTEVITLFQENGFGIQNIHVNKDGDTILHSLINLICLKDWTTAFRTQLKDFLCNKMAKDPSVLQLLREMAKMSNKAGLTPLHHLLQNFQDKKLPENTANNYYLDTLSFLVNDLNSDVDAVVGDKSKSTPLHLAIDRPTYSVESMQQLLAKQPNLDCLNLELKTPLVVAIEKQREAAAKYLIQSGADVNFISRKHHNKAVLILAGENFCNSFNIIPSLIEKNVKLNTFDNKNGNSVLHLLAMKPNVPNVADVFKKLITAGCDVMETNSCGQTPLHVVINERGGETDVSYDLEELIIEANPQSLIQQDAKGRIPLHNVFMKQSKSQHLLLPNDLPVTKIDPIELVALLTRSMKELAASPQSIFTKDNQGATPLHYAAQCGSIICISLLISELKASMARSSLDERDGNGNTAFGLSVWKGNDGAALQFQQNGADFLCLLNTYDKKKEKPASDFEWNPSLQLRSEKERQLKQSLRYPILQEVINQNQQGLLHLMIEKLSTMTNGHGIINAVEAALKTRRFKLAMKLLHRSKSFSSSLQSKSTGTMFHIMGKTEPDNNAAQQAEVVQSLLSKNVSLQASDEVGANALIYAAINWNTKLCEEFTRVIGLEEVARMRPDNLRRTPFSSLFWKMNSKKASESIPDGLKNWAVELVRLGASPNVLTSYPIILSTYPGIACSMVDDNKNTHNTLCTPLMMAVVSRNYDAVKWLLNLSIDGKAKIDLDTQDELGRTALMHAIKLNDIKMVKLLLNPRSYEVDNDLRPWHDNTRRKKKQSKESMFTAISKPNLNIADANQYTVLHYLACPLKTSADPICFVNSIRILQLFVSSLDLNGLVAMDPGMRRIVQAVLEVAKTTTKYLPFIERIEEILRLPSPQKSKPSPSYDFMKVTTMTTFNPELTECIERDRQLSSQEVLKKVQENYGTAMDIDGVNPANVKFQLKPDSLAGLKKGHAIIIQDTAQDNLPFDVLLTQVDLQYGAFGLYNFYKMQLIKQVKGKELILLFTRWGRVGDQGQFQKTPFPDEESAIKEFKKIFRAKTGNNWETLAQFNPLPKKYRLVNVERRKARKDQLTKVKVDFGVIEKAEKRIPSKIGENKVLSLVKKLCLAHQKPSDIKKDDNDDEDANTEVGTAKTIQPQRMKLEALVRVGDGEKDESKEDEEEEEEPAADTASSSDQEDKVIEDDSDSDEDYKEGSGLSVGLLNKDTLEKGNEILNQISKLVLRKEKLSKTVTSSNEENAEIYNSLIKLSEEYYTLIPVRGFSFERIEPVFDVNKLREVQLQIHHLVHLEFATKVLLASTLKDRADKFNPYDYVYKSINTEIEIMDPGSDECQLILQYIHNTGGGQRKPQVEAIYRIERLNEMKALQETGIDNRWLLWHGTSTKNILSILHSGLQAVPLGAQLSGSAFGKGIYFADMFEKSNHFTYNDGADKDPSKFMFLCEVALGKVQDVDIHSDQEYEIVDAEFDSFKTINSQYEPDPATTIFWNGRTVPLGKKTKYLVEERETISDPYIHYGLDFNEYVVFNPNQVCLRYLVQFRD